MKKNKDREITGGILLIIFGIGFTYFGGLSCIFGIIVIVAGIYAIAGDDN